MSEVSMPACNGSTLQRSRDQIIRMNHDYQRPLHWQFMGLVVRLEVDVHTMINTIQQIRHIKCIFPINQSIIDVDQWVNAMNWDPAMNCMHTDILGYPGTWPLFMFVFI
eukprot:217630_1